MKYRQCPSRLVCCICARDSAGFLEVRGSPELAKKELEAMSRAFPDFHFTVGDVIAEGDKVVGRWTLIGTHGGEYKGIPATNKKVKMWGIEIFRVVGDKFVEGWVRSDRLDMMQQQGIIPAPKERAQ